MLLVTSGASLFRSILARKGINRASDKVNKGDGIIRTGDGSSKNKDF